MSIPIDTRVFWQPELACLEQARRKRYHSGFLDIAVVSPREAVAMQLRIDNQGQGECYISLSGRISQTSVGQQVDHFSQLLGEANYNQNILLSLAQTDYIDSSGIGWLLAADKKIRSAGGRLVLHSLPIDVQHVFGLMKLQKVLHIARDREQASSLGQSLSNPNENSSTSDTGGHHGN